MMYANACIRCGVCHEGFAGIYTVYDKLLHRRAWPCMYNDTAQNQVVGVQAFSWA